MLFKFYNCSSYNRLTILLTNLLPELSACDKSHLPSDWLFNTNVYSIHVIRTGEKNFPNLFTERWWNVLKREKLRWSERDHLFLWSCCYYRRSWFWPASLFLMRRQPNVSDLERSWKPLINKEQKTLFKLQSERSKKFYSPQLQSSKNIVPTKSNRTSKLFFWYSERQHCLSLQYTMLASHHLIYIKLKQSVQLSMLCLCWFVWIT